MIKIKLHYKPYIMVYEVHDVIGITVMRPLHQISSVKNVKKIVHLLFLMMKQTLK